MSDEIMPRGGKREGAGRKPGVPNKITSVAREAFLATFQRLAPDLEGWIKQAAEKDPARAADLLVKMAEYHFPKLGRTEVTGDGGGPVEFVIRDMAKEQP